MSLNLTRDYLQTRLAWVIAQSPKPIYSHGKAYLSKQTRWYAATDPCLACGRPRVQAPTPTGALRMYFFSTPFLPPSGDSFYTPSPLPPVVS